MLDRISTSLPLALVLAAGGCLNVGDPPQDTDTDTSTSGDTTTTSSSTTTTTTATTGETTTTSDPVCGNGVKEDGEECDDGTANADDAACTAACKSASCGDGKVWAGMEACDDGNDVDTDACLSTCKAASCGDGFIHAGVEVCDDGTNDGAYGGCAADCKAEGPKCGDGVVQEEHEACDSDDITTGCVACQVAPDCAAIKAFKADAASGLYTIDPVPGNIPPLQVFCEMDADDGGYTLAKVGRPTDHTAAQAEAVCAAYGMHLFVPRTPAHLLATYNFVTSINMVPLDVDDLPASSYYLTILGIYPVTVGQSCVDKPLNSADCPEWRATDDGPFWVTDKVIETEPSTSNCAGCSMLYDWNLDGTIKVYQAIGLKGGGKSSVFVCSIGDK